MVAPLIALVATAWVALLVATPLLPTPVATLVYGVGSFICHQLPDRSFHLGEFQLPVCARCLGIYAGLAAGALRGITHHADASLTPRAARWTIAVAALPTIVTVVLEWLGVWQVSNMGRAVAGSTLGVGMALVVVSALATLHYSSCVLRRPTVPNPRPPHT